MKWAVLLVAVFFVENAYGQHFKKFRHGVPPPDTPNTRAAMPEYGWITQRVDHFNPSDLKTWEMRYLTNGQFFKEGGPIFIYIGGEWSISPGWLMSGLMYDMAEEHGGYMFYTEHRYYGTSFPTTDLSVKNMQYLNVDQALADLAYFIEHKKSTIPGLQNSKVVVVGGSYSATMATWMRIKYPHLVDVAWASSAPLRAVADFYEYYEVVGRNLALASSECVEIISDAMAEVERQLETQQGNAYISNMFNTCGPINTTEPERSYFFMSLASPFAGLVQYAYVGQLEYECSRLVEFPGTPVEKLAAYVNDYYEDFCITDYQYFVDWYDSVEIPETYEIIRQWYYQTCTEYGFYQTSSSPNQPFGLETFKLSMSIQMCQDLFGYGAGVLNAGIERTNLLYGSIEPEMTKVISIHGTVDPWHAIGVLEDVNPDAPVVVVNGTSHCADMYSISEGDIPEMLAAKLRVKEEIAKWLQS